MGANNVLENNQLTSLNDSPYKFWKSRFYEVGFTFKYRLKEEASKLELAIITSNIGYVLFMKKYKGAEKDRNA